VRDLLSRIAWPQLAALAMVIGGALAALLFTPPETIEKIAAADWRAIGGAVVLVIGALQGALGGAPIRPREMPSIPPMSMPPPSMVPPELPGTPTNPGKPSLMPRESAEED
jgi:hypothetical protein